jgi:excinuclease ABC subunit B
MRAMMDVTESRRARQLAYNREHGITPRGVVSEIKAPLVPGAPDRWGELSERAADGKGSRKMGSPGMLPSPDYLYDVEAVVAQLRSEMLQAAEALDFETAAELRDQISELRGGKSPVKRPRKPRHGPVNR